MRFIILILLILASEIHALCEEDPNNLIAAAVGIGNNVFITCGQLAAFPQSITPVCSLDPKAVAQDLSPAVQCVETCGTGGGSESPNSKFLILIANDDDNPVVHNPSCGWLSQQSNRVVNYVCNLDLSAWDTYAASNTCCQTCTEPTDTPTTVSPTSFPSPPPSHPPSAEPTPTPTTTTPPTTPPSLPPAFFQGPFITPENSSENIIIPDPTEPDLTAEPSNCPHLQPGLLHWHDAATWGPDGIPPPGEDVTLPPNTSILLNETIASVLGLITIPSTSQLIIGENPAGISVDTTGFEVIGALIAGSETCRLQTPLTITLHGTRPVDIVTNARPPSYKGISVMGGVLELHGRRFYRTWTRLAQAVSPGDTRLFLQHPVNWESGQEVLLVTTAMKDSRDWHQNERLTIASVQRFEEGSGVPPSVVYLTSPVQEVHVANTGYQAEVGLLSRTIVVRGAEGDSEPSDPDLGGCTGDSIFGDSGRPCEDRELTGYGGHIMVWSAGKGYVEGVELYRMGQTNVIGRYPIHFHVLADGCTDCYFRDSSVHRSYYRCISIHGTNGMEVSENVGYDVIGYCYYLEDGVEEENTISFNLAALIHMIGTPARGGGQTVDLVYQSEDITLPADITAAGYYITNLRNNLIGNAASGGWAGYAFPTLHSPIGSHTQLNTRPSDRLALIIDGNTAHSTGWWWSHAGAFYFGGSLYYEDANDLTTLVYNAGRDQTHPRKPCLFDRCEVTGDCEAYCPPEELAWNVVTNSKVFVVPSVGLGSWSGRMEIVGFEAHDVGLGLEALESGFWIDDLLVVCRSGDVLAMPSSARANYIKGNGFVWYDTGQEHIITHATFRNCGQRNGYDEYDTSPTRGCDDSPDVGCNSGSTVFGFLTHSDQFTPELMQATRNVTFEDCGRRFRLIDFKTDNEVPTVSGRNQNWLDVDGSVSGLGEPTLIGSGLPSAGLWWTVDSEVVHDPHGPLEFIKQNNGPERGLAHIRLEWDSILHSTVGITSCGNGDLLPCPTLGRIRHFGPMFDLTQDPLGGLPITAQAEVVGPTGGYGWLLSLDDGAPKTLRIGEVEVDPSTPLVLAIAYPIGTSFMITAESSVYCYDDSFYSCTEEFYEVGSVSAVRYSEGNVYYFDGVKGLLYVRVIMPPQDYTGDTTFDPYPSWHLWDYDTVGKWGKWYAINRFARDGIILPKKAYGPRLTIHADCPVDGDNDSFCSQSPPPNAEPDVCSPGYEQVAYDQCCTPESTSSVFSPTVVECEFFQTLPPSTSAPTPTPSSNLVKNPGFEEGLNYWLAKGGTTTITLDSSDPQEGSSAVLVTGRTAAWNGVEQNLLPVLETITTTYDVSCWVKLHNHDSTAFFKLTIQVIDDNGTTWRNVNNMVSEDSWTLVSGSITVSVLGNVTTALLYAEGPESGVDFYLDDVSVVKQ